MAGVAALSAFDKFAVGIECTSGKSLRQPPASSSAIRSWRELRKQFPIPADVVHLNTATVGSCPFPVIDAVSKAYLETERLIDPEPEDYPVWGYDGTDYFRRPLAAFLGVPFEQLAIVHNATEGCNFIANGVEMARGDEVLISDQEHPAGEQPWQLRARRYGIVVKKFPVGKPPKNKDEILNAVNDAITPRTKMIFVSHISYVSGTVLPVREICALARSKNILSAIDGAQVSGMMRLNVSEVGCDMYTGSPHKWLFAPKGTGFLYISDSVMDKVWSTITNSGWLHPELRAARFQQFGTGNVPCLWGLLAAIDFYAKVGAERIEIRNRELADYVYVRLLRRGAQPLTPLDSSMHCGIVAVDVPSINRMELETWLWKEHKVRIRGGEPSRLRLSPSYVSSEEELDRFLDLFDEFLRMKGINA